jgi:hypothetical protein
MAAELHVVGLYGPRPALFGRNQSDVTDWPGFCAKLVAKGPLDAPSPERQVWQLLSDDVRKLVRNAPLIKNISEKKIDRTDYELRLKLMAGFEGVLKSRKLYDIEAFAGVKLPEATQELAVRRRELSLIETRWLNRLLLEAAFPKEIRHATDEPPELVTVQVTATKTPMVLALTAFESVRWKIEAAEGVTIEKVIVGGHDLQEVTGTRAEVEMYTAEGAPPDTALPEWFNAWETETGDFDVLQTKLRKLTGLPIATFQGMHRHDGKPFVIDGVKGKPEE